MTRWAPGITFAGDLPRRRRLRHPRRAQVEVEVHRAGQADRAQHVREDVSLHADTSCAGRAGMRSGRRGRPAALADGRQNKSDAGAWPLTRAPP